MTACPCNSGKDFDTCCGPFLDGSAKAPTAEALMRSRYSAHVKGNYQYVADTHAPEAAADYNISAAQAQSKNTEWTGLEITETTDGGSDDDTGTVTFTARFTERVNCTPIVRNPIFAVSTAHGFTWMVRSTPASSHAALTKSGAMIPARVVRVKNSKNAVAPTKALKAAAALCNVDQAVPGRDAQGKNTDDAGDRRTACIFIVKTLAKHHQAHDG